MRGGARADCVADRVPGGPNSAIGGLLGNLKSGRGLFGEEATQKVARQALEIVEEQVLEVAQEIRAEEGATKVKKVRCRVVPATSCALRLMSSLVRGSR
jgi:hypothetical protein